MALRGDTTMKKIVSVFMIIFLGLSLTGLAFAQGKERKEVAWTAKSDRVQGEQAKFEMGRMGGVVTAVDPKAGTISIHQETVRHDRMMVFPVNDKVAGELQDIKPGDLVNIWVNHGIVTEMNEVG